MANKTHRHLVAAGFALLLTAGWSAPVRSDDPVTSSVRFNREIVRIFERKCLACHSSGGIAMSLATHREARPWARAIREEIVDQRMPPWSAARGSARFENDIGLTPRELTTILTWVDGGVPRGDDVDLPAKGATGTPGPHTSSEYSITLPPQAVPGDGGDVVSRVTVDGGVTSDRWVHQLRFRPGDRRLLRAAFVTVVARDERAPAAGGAAAQGMWVAAWTPWQTEIRPPFGGAFLLRAGSRLAIELHYRGRETAAVDTSFIDMVIAPGTAWKESASFTIPARPAGGAAARDTGQLSLTRATTVWALRPESLSEGQSFEVTAHKPDGSADVLLWIPRYHADWPAPFVLAEPVVLPAGTSLRVTAGGGPRATGARATLAVHY